MSIELISVHFPKAGGSSLRQSLLDAFGEKSILFNYQDDPVDPLSLFNVDPQKSKMTAKDLAPEIKVVHGHFNPLKYEAFLYAKWINFLRHPIDNLILIYFFWKQNREPGHAISNYFRTNILSLLDLTNIPKLRFLLSKTYFGDFDMRKFDFIGFVESYSEDIRSLSYFL